MINFSNKKLLIKVGVFLSIFIFCIFIEVFIFNFNYFTIPKNDRGLTKLNMNQLVLNDLKIDGGKLVTTGSNPYFQIPGNKYISYLKVNPDSNSGNFEIDTYDTKGTILKKYNTNTDLEKYIFIKLDTNTSNITFHVDLTKINKTVAIDDITMDNSLDFNILRLLLMISISFIIGFLLCFRGVAKEKLHITFLVILFTLGITISLLTPIYFSFDEKEHFVKSYKTASFDLGFSNQKPINWISNIDDFFKFNGNYNFNISYKEKIENSKTFSSNNYSNKKFYNSAADTYLFIPYIPSAIGIGIGKTLSLSFIITFYLGRFFSLLIYGIIGYLILKYIKIAKELVFMILLLPAVVFGAGVYSADSMTVIFAVASVAIFINMLSSKERTIDYKMILGFAACVAITTMSKVSYAPLCLLILAVPRTKLKNNKKINELTIKIATLSSTALVSCGTLLFAITRNLNQWSIPGVSVKGQVLFIIKNIPQFIYIVMNFISGSALTYFEGSSTFFAYCGGLDSIWLLIIIISLFIVAVIDDESDILKLRILDKACILFSIILSWGLVISALYITFNPVGSYTISGVQGRYFAPLLLPLFLLFKNSKVSNKFKKGNLNYFIIMECTLLLFVAALKLFLQFNI